MTGPWSWTRRATHNQDNERTRGAHHHRQGRRRLFSVLAPTYNRQQQTFNEQAGKLRHLRMMLLATVAASTVLDAHDSATCPGAANLKAEATYVEAFQALAKEMAAINMSY